MNSRDEVQQGRALHARTRHDKTGQGVKVAADLLGAQEGSLSYLPLPLCGTLSLSLETVCDKNKKEQEKKITKKGREKKWSLFGG
jgi:hypothetical protein